MPSNKEEKMQNHFVPTRLAALVAVAFLPAWAQAAYPPYEAGKSYGAGDVVSNVGALYQCKEFPYSGWCGASPYHYEPGVGVNWSVPGCSLAMGVCLPLSSWASAHRQREVPLTRAPMLLLPSP